MKPRTTLTGKCRIVLSDKEREKLETSVGEDDEVVEAAETTLVEDSDDGEYNVVEEVRKEVEKTVSVEDVPKKKKVVKKKPVAAVSAD